MKLAAMALLAGCSLPTPAEHCREICEFYSDCDPALFPLEAACIAGCEARFADPMEVAVECLSSAPRHPADQDRFPSVQSSVIEAGQCAIDAGCEPDPDDCEDLEQVCLDDLSRSELCNRRYSIEYARCVAVRDYCRGRRQPSCASDFDDCISANDRSAASCLDG